MDGRDSHDQRTVGPKDGPRLPYMPGLDGLRAFAVAGVVLYHAGAAWVPGGFLGVDVFFALSGYLITSLLLVEFARRGRIDLKRFWLGRARRLLPAALLVIGLSLVIVALFVPSQLAQARGDAIASALYVNNWHQILADRSYFEAFGRPSLYQHLWSLAVEEQFYLLWPLLLTFGLTRLGRRRTVWAMLGMALVSLLLMAVLYDPDVDPSRVYYGTDTRAAQLLFGALLAFAWPPGRLTGRTGRGAATVLDGIGLAALALLLWAMLGWQDYDRFVYQGGLGVVALATVAVIAALVHPASRIGRVFGVAPLRWIGQRSYGIYLFHWPVMALSRPGVDIHASSTLIAIGQIAVTLGLAALSYRYVEMPVRRGEALPWIRSRLDALSPRRRLGTATGVAALLALLLAFPFLRHAAEDPVTGGDKPLATSAAKAAPKTTTTTAAQTANGPVVSQQPPLAVGASVMLAAQPALQKALGPQARIDAAVGRQAADIAARIEAYALDGALPDRVIVQVGENGPLTSSDMDRLHAVLRGIPRVVFVNVRVPRSWEAESNSVLEDGIEDWPEARIADWNAASSDPSLLFDGAHPNEEGQQVYARVVDKALEAP
ncbi:MAG TPA: acyltransferase family protein [Capillimicrobium sp.]|nr:acyltransferase family protein [Capillimicrobium sp.]